jgi:DnaJ family protein B protein 6
VYLFNEFADKRRRNYDTTGSTGFNTGNNGRRSSNADFEFDWSSSSFKFRTPEEVFREFFRGDPFADLFADHFSQFGGGRTHHQNNRASHPNGMNNRHSTGGSLQSIFSPFGLGMSLNMSGFGLDDDDFWGVGMGGGSQGGNVKKTSTSTRFVNGKKITTKK